MAPDEVLIAPATPLTSFSYYSMPIIEFNRPGHLFHVKFDGDLLLDQIRFNLDLFNLSFSVISFGRYGDLIVYVALEGSRVLVRQIHDLPSVGYTVGRSPSVSDFSPR